MGEFLSESFDTFLALQGTEHRLTVHDTPKYNGVAECLNWTLILKVCALLHDSSLPKFLWGEALQHTMYLKNQSPTCALEGKTPYEIFHG